MGSSVGEGIANKGGEGEEKEAMGEYRNTCTRLEIFRKKIQRAAGSFGAPMSQFRLTLCVTVRCYLV